MHIWKYLQYNFLDCINTWYTVCYIWLFQFSYKLQNSTNVKVCNENFLNYKKYQITTGGERRIGLCVKWVGDGIMLKNKNTSTPCQDILTFSITSPRFSSEAGRDAILLLLFLLWELWLEIRLPVLAWLRLPAGSCPPCPCCWEWSLSLCWS